MLRIATSAQYAKKNAYQNQFLYHREETHIFDTQTRTKSHKPLWHAYFWPEVIIASFRVFSVIVSPH